jgi:hypothetical protein
MEAREETLRCRSLKNTKELKCLSGIEQKW